MSIEDAVPSPELSSRPSRVASRLPLVVFGVVEATAIPVLLHAGNKRWFFGDDWFFLASTTRGGLRTVLKTNTYGHWMTLPILAYRFLWWLFGLRHFTAFLLLVILLHLATAALLRAVMRRCGAGPWISTIAASMLVFFGAGASDILQPFQITFDGALVFGLTHLLLADHDGRLNRRDVAGLVCGLAGLMCSNVSIAMVATVGLAVLLRRGWRAALFHTVPLGAIYIAWWSIYARSAHGLLGKRASIGELVRYVWKGVRVTFEALGHFPVVGLLLAAIFVVGLILAWTRGSGISRRRSAAAAALVGGAVIFIASAGLLRASPAITPAAQSGYVSRYVYVSAAMLLPALAVAVTALVRRRRWLAPITAVALLVGLPGNFHALTAYGASFPRHYEHGFLVLAHSPVARRVPPFLRVPPGASPGYMDAGWLVAGVESGRIPDLGRHASPQESASAALTLSLSRYLIDARPRRCRPIANSVVLQRGDQIAATSGAFDLVSDAGAGVTSAPWHVVAPQRFQAFTGPLSLRIERYPAQQGAGVKRCTLVHR